MEAQLSILRLAADTARVMAPCRTWHLLLMIWTDGTSAFQRQDGNTITFQVHVPATAPVGVWNCWVQTNRFGQRDNRHDYKCDEDIYMLFNPWCREDPVYMDNESSRKEYVLNEQGKIWCGTWRQPKGRKWIYGQFDDVVLPACMYLLERSGLEHSERGNPVRVCRAISSMVSILIRIYIKKIMRK